MIRIMFVCLGNICRSPMAEFVFKDMLEKENASGEFLVASSAVSAEELGNPVYPPARAELKKHGISSDGKYAVQLKCSDYDKYDLFVCMDESNVRAVKRLFSGDEQNKVKLLLSYAGENRGVSDPYYTRAFDVAYDDVVKGCAALLKCVKE